jgi:hypothetical protein
MRRPLESALQEINDSGPTLMVLEGRDLVTGLGLAAFMLILFPAPGSGTPLCLLTRFGPPTLLGLAGFLFGPLVVFTGGGGWAMMVAAAGRRNIPRFISQSKYRSPCTLPSFFPS